MNFDRKLMAYVAGAAAAALAGNQSADATLIFRSGFDISSGSTNNLDFNADGADEFRIAHRTGPDRVFLKDSTTAGTTNSFITAGDATPAALAFDSLIGPSGTYAPAADSYLANPDGTPTGHFTVDSTVGNTEYLGLRFQFEGSPQIYYGWAGVDITNAATRTGTVTSYAYDDTGAAVRAGVVPEPAGLALLAVGAAALLRRRTA